MQPVLVESLVVNMNIVHVKIKKIRDVAMFGRCLEIKREIQLYIVASLVVKMNINIERVQKEMGDVSMIAGSNSVVNIEPFFYK